MMVVFCSADVRLLERVNDVYRVANNMMPSSRVVAMTEFLGSFSDWLSDRQSVSRAREASELVGNYPALPFYDPEGNDVTSDYRARMFADLDAEMLMRFAAIKYSADQYRARGEIPTDLL